MDQPVVLDQLAEEVSLCFASLVEVLEMLPVPGPVEGFPQPFVSLTMEKKPLHVIPLMSSFFIGFSLSLVILEGPRE